MWVSIVSYEAMMGALQALDHRAVSAMMADQPRRVTADAVTALRMLIAEYRLLLGQCGDDFLARQVRQRVPDSQEWVGRARRLGMATDASLELEAAAAAWAANGESEHAARVRDPAR
jgi:hypothetical protein